MQCLPVRKKLGHGLTRKNELGHWNNIFEAFQNLFRVFIPDSCLPVLYQSFFTCEFGHYCGSNRGPSEPPWVPSLWKPRQIHRCGTLLISACENRTTLPNRTHKINNQYSLVSEIGTPTFRIFFKTKNRSFLAST